MQFHVDMDAFYASVEQLDRPELAGMPVIVGAAPGHRGVVSTCSYEARAFGVHSAMPISEAVRLCPGGIFLPVRMERYLELSRTVMDILGEFSPDLRQISVDEAFLDMTGTEGLWGAPREAATRLKEEVRNRTGLTVSVGAASNRYIAKIASGFRKPDGLTIVPPGGEEEFMSGLPIGKLWGAGEKTQERFRELGIRSVPQLRAIGKAGLSALFGNAGGAFLYAAACGQDPGIFRTEPGSRSMSTERTFGRDIADPE
ncbi:MAG TPA: DNA polymerase IV, partial [Spirochaetia bacterium]|nr:DNA polymerase IV [Spirochaetia bacterium]